MSSSAETAPSPWHDGEIGLQKRLGMAEQMDQVGRRVLRTFLIDQHREFYPLLPFIVIGSVDPEGNPWATIRAGRPGFLHAPDPHHLSIAAARDPDDPAERGLEDGDAVGLVGVDLMTRRRNRLNGTVSRSGNDRFEVIVGQSFGNCPRYIRNRHLSFTRDPAMPAASPPLVLDRLNDTARSMIREADTFFVASYADRPDAGRQVDVSHRGGKPGFVHIDAEGCLTVPDFSGNMFFNTLGNFAVNPRAGLVFFDAATGGMLHLTGQVNLILESPEISAFEGAERLWRLRPDKIVLRPDTLPLRGLPAENTVSPNNPMTNG